MNIKDILDVNYINLYDRHHRNGFYGNSIEKKVKK
ncbi:MAG: hypothetical protein PWQ97_382 [Tepidanaerobacteraceae bacterium]|nr:hypothetical protein [Tepidanaerobacteraceae bacterium]